MRGVTTLKVIEKPTTLCALSGKNREVYGKIINTLDIMGATKCIELSPDEIRGKTYTSKVNNIRSGLHRLIRILKKGYTPVVSYNKENDVIYIWSRMKIK